MTVGDEPFGHHLIPLAPLRLEVRRVRATNARAFIPIEAQPPHAVENPFDHLFR
jgi:hypothetical protein